PTIRAGTAGGAWPRTGPRTSRARARSRSRRSRGPRARRRRRARAPPGRAPRAWPGLRRSASTPGSPERLANARDDLARLGRLEDERRQELEDGGVVRGREREDALVVEEPRRDV